MTVPAGVYKGRIVKDSAQYGLTRKGDDQIVLDIEVALAEGEVRRLSTFLYFSDAAAAYSLDRLRAGGWTGDDVTDLTGVDTRLVDVEIKYETWEGEQRMRVQILTGGGSVRLENTMNEKQKQMFAARMKALAKGGGQPRAPRAAPAQPRRAPAGADRPFGDDAPPGGAADDDFAF